MLNGSSNTNASWLLYRAGDYRSGGEAMYGGRGVNRDDVGRRRRKDVVGDKGRRRGCDVAGDEGRRRGWYAVGDHGRRRGWYAVGDKVRRRGWYAVGDQGRRRGEKSRTRPTLGTLGKQYMFTNGQSNPAPLIDKTKA